MKKIYIIFFALISCIEPVDLKTEASESFLVVEGELTNLEGPYTVKISRSKPLSTDIADANVLETISSARVKIVDNSKAKTYLLSETAPGIYATGADFVNGVPGRSYYLEININDIIYRSEIQELTQPVPMDSIYFEHNAAEKVLEVYLDMDDPSVENYYFWDWTAYYEIITFLPEPVTCCHKCFVDVEGNNMIIETDEFVNGNFIQKKYLTDIPLTIPTRYLLDIRQYNIKKEDFRFLKILNQQRDQGAGLFNPQQSNNRGNIFNINDPQENVLGYFLVAGASTKSISVHRKHYFNEPVYTSFQDDCRLLPNTDTIPPVHWPF